MRRSVRNADDQGKSATNKVPTTADVENACRCKTVSKKSLSELLKLMIRDLAFWKRAKRN